MTKGQIEKRLREILEFYDSAMTLDGNEFLLCSFIGKGIVFGRGKTIQEAIFDYDRRMAKLSDRT